MRWWVVLLVLGAGACTAKHSPENAEEEPLLEAAAEPAEPVAAAPREEADLEEEKAIFEALRDFRSSDWPTVQRGRRELEQHELAGLIALASLLDDHNYIPLENTADLIYPGARYSYGHGYAIPYDLDFIRVRAGWAIEEMTGKNFGFSMRTVVEHKNTLSSPPVLIPERFPEEAARAAIEWTSERPAGWRRPASR